MQVEHLQEYVDDVCKDIGYYKATKPVSFRIPLVTFDALRKDAKQKKISLSTLVNTILQCYTDTTPKYK